MERKVRRRIALFLAVLMMLSLMPVNMFGTVKAYAAEQNPLTTVVKEAAIGAEGGSYTLEDGVFTITGAGTVFDKDSGNDSLYYTYFKVNEGTQTVVAKVTPTTAAASGQMGILVRNGLEATDMAAALYYDMGKAQVRLGRHGGASGLTDVAITDSFYVKLELSTDAVYCTLASDAAFENVLVARKGMGATGLETQYIGFFATEGNVLTVSDVEIISNYTEEGASAATKKIVYSSVYGELIPAFAKSSDFGETYDAAFVFSSSVDGNELNLVSDRNGSANKGDIRQGTTTDYFWFPETTENWTVQADVQINSINNGTDKQGIAVGQFATPATGNVYGTFLQANKNLAMQHNYATGDSANGGNPKSSESIAIDGSATYTMSYAKNADGTATMMAYTAAGVAIVDGSTSPFTLANGSEHYVTGAPVHYGLAISGADVTVTNLKLVNEAGYVIYDQNDYYIAVGVAPVVGEVTAVIPDDRLTIDLTWTDETEGTGNIQYIVMVSKDGGEYVATGTSKVKEFAYTPAGDGTYSFQVYGKSGDSVSSDLAKTSNEVTYMTPLVDPVLTAVGDADSVKIDFTLSAGATAYDIYRAVTSAGEFSVLTTINAADLAADATTASYTDTPDAEVPVYYYVVAKNDTNSSNPSDTIQALRTAGHAGEYAAGNEADKLTITSKTNDTVFDGKFEVKGTYAVDGSYVVNVNGVAGESVTYTAGSEAVIAGELADGRNDVEVIFTNASGVKSRTTFNFVNNPAYDIVVDAAYTGAAGEKVDGVPTYATLGAALATIAADNASQVTIFVKNGSYNERVVVTAPNVSILGEDSKNTKVFASVAVSDKTATGMWDRNAFYVDSTADGFTLENIWVENSFPYSNGNDQQADALAIVADNVIVINVSLIGYQDTLLIDSRVKDSTGGYEVTNQYFYKCYITGNVDFIYGSGTAVFEDCDVVGRYTEFKSDGCFTAARTYDYVNYGLIFNNCRFYAEDGIAAGAYRLARPWGADASTVFINCYMSDVVTDVGYGDMSGNSYKNARFAEYNTYGTAFKVNNDRPLLSADQAAAYATATVLGADFAYETVMAEMYKGSAANPEQPENPVDPTLNGLVQLEDGTFQLYIEGVADTTTDILYQYDGRWFILTDGKVDTALVGIVDYDNSKFYVSDGQVSDVDGLVLNTDGTWYYVADGMVQVVSTLVQYDGQWFVVKDGKMDASYTGLYEYDGATFVVADGRLATEINGLVQIGADWYYFTNGQVAQYTGLVEYNGAWFYVADGKFDTTYTGCVDYAGSVFQVVGGSVTIQGHTSVGGTCTHCGKITSQHGTLLNPYA